MFPCWVSPMSSPKRSERSVRGCCWTSGCTDDAWSVSVNPTHWTPPCHRRAAGTGPHLLAEQQRFEATAVPQMKTSSFMLRDTKWRQLGQDSSPDRTAPLRFTAIINGYVALVTVILTLSHMFDIIFLFSPLKCIFYFLFFLKKVSHIEYELEMYQQ